MRRVLIILAALAIAMPVATRLLIAGGTGGFTQPAPTLAALTTALDGGWTQTSGPKAAYYNGVTYFGYVDGSNGQIEIRTYTHATATISAATVLHTLTADTHDGPSIWVRDSDKRIVVYYSDHLGPTMYQWVSTNPEDISAGTETSLDASLGGRKYTYPHVGQIGDGSIYLAFRDHFVSDADSYLALASSSDGGATWDAESRFMYNAGHDCYQMVHFGANGRIDFAVSDGNGVTDTHISVYHLYWQAGVWHKTDGTVISASLPFAPSAATLVHDGSAYPNGWPTGVTVDDTGAPVILYETLDTANGHSYAVKYARWNGSAWVSTQITTLDDTGLALVSHSALDESDGHTAWIAKPVSGVFEMSRYRTPDYGTSWSAAQITSGSSGSGNVYPANVHNRASDLRALWLYGTFTTYLSFSFGIKLSGN